MDLLIYALCLTIAVKTNSISRKWFWVYAVTGIVFGVGRIAGIV